MDLELVGVGEDNYLACTAALAYHYGLQVLLRNAFSRVLPVLFLMFSK